MVWLTKNQLRVVLGVSMLAVFACSDDGVPAQTHASGETGDDGATGSSPTGGAPTSGTAGVTTGPEEGTSGPGEGTGDDSGDDTGEATTGEDTDGESAMQCRSDRDCMVVDDCCTCAAQHVDDEVPPCDMVCIVGKCTEEGIPEIGATCRFGTCVFEKVSCDPSQVVCLSLPPACAHDGYLPSVENDCWTGDCVPAHACDIVPSCDDCLAHEACVEIQTQLGPSYACEPIAPVCDGAPTCACMSDACPEPYDTCTDGANGLECSCLAC
jgi:hypothetical protein